MSACQLHHPALYAHLQIGQTRQPSKHPVAKCRQQVVAQRSDHQVVSISCTTGCLQLHSQSLQTGQSLEQSDGHLCQLIAVQESVGLNALLISIVKRIFSLSVSLCLSLACYSQPLETGQPFEEPNAEARDVVAFQIPVAHTPQPPLAKFTRSDCTRASCSQSLQIGQVVEEANTETCKLVVFQIPVTQLSAVQLASQRSKGQTLSLLTATGDW
jgi:hypothetical protein